MHSFSKKQPEHEINKNMLLPSGKWSPRVYKYGLPRVHMKSCEYSCRHTPREIVKKVGNEYSQGRHPLSNRSEGIPDRKRLLKCRFAFFLSRLALFAAILFSLSSPSSSLPSVRCEDLGTSKRWTRCRKQRVLHRSILFFLKWWVFWLSAVAWCFSFTKSDQRISLQARFIAQIIIVGAQVVGRTFTQALRQEFQSKFKWCNRSLECLHLFICWIGSRTETSIVLF